MAKRVTNHDLMQELSRLSARLDIIEAEAKVAKWVLRMIGLLFGSVITAIVTHWKGWTR